MNKPPLREPLCAIMRHGLTSIKYDVQIEEEVWSRLTELVLGQWPDQLETAPGSGEVQLMGIWCEEGT